MDVIWPKPGRYVIAVSGGVDSVALLDMLAQNNEYELIVAHVDHGVREDSASDAAFVRRLASSYGFTIVTTTYNYTKNTSENELRQARYSFLLKVMQDHGALGIITAHHFDDLLETSIMNIHRGTDRYGAAGGMSRQGIIRPLINLTKKDLIGYAKAHSLAWREDCTNQDNRYTRNKIRHDVIPGMDIAAYQEQHAQLRAVNKKIDNKLSNLVSTSLEHITVRRIDLHQLGLRELEVLLAYAIRKSRPESELSAANISRLAREIMLNSRKKTFSYIGLKGIIVHVP